MNLTSSEIHEKSEFGNQIAKKLSQIQSLYLESSFNQQDKPVKRLSTSANQDRYINLYLNKYNLLLLLAGFLIFQIIVYLFQNYQFKILNQTLQFSQTVDEKLRQKSFDINQNLKIMQMNLNEIQEIELMNKQSSATSSKLYVINEGKLSQTKQKSEKNSQTLLNLPLIKPNGQRIQDVIYKNDTIRKERIDFQKKKVAFINSNPNIYSFYLTKYNIIMNPEEGLVAIKENQNDWNRLELKFKLSIIKEELQMCIIIPGFNNNADFRIQQNLNSVFLQNYTNYKAIIINDASTDGSDQVYRKYFEFYGIDQKYYIYIQNKKRVTALQNIYNVSIQHCPLDSIVITLDADDQFVGRNVLQVFNWGFQTKKAGVIYSNFIRYNKNEVRLGPTRQYTIQQKQKNLYRNVVMKFSHLRSYRSQLLHQIDPKDLKDEKGMFFTYTYDMALFYPLMELSCGRVFKIEDEYHYLYNTGTGLNDFNNNAAQHVVEDIVRKKKKYQCYKPFNLKMNKLK